MCIVFSCAVCVCVHVFVFVCVFLHACICVPMCSLEHTSVLPVLTERHVRAGVVTAVLKELMAAPEVTSEHLVCFLLEMTIESSLVPHFDASWLRPEELFMKKVYNVQVYQKLMDSGMPVDASAVEKAVTALSKEKVKLFQLLVCHCLNKEHLFTAYEVATSLRRKRFIDILKKCFEVCDVALGVSR